MKTDIIMSLTIGVSSVHKGLIQLRECNDEAVKALEHSVIKGKDSIIYFNELAEAGSYYYYPIEIELQLINIIKTGDYENAEKTIDLLFEVNFISRKINFETGRYLIIDIVSTFMNITNIIQQKDTANNVPMDDMVKHILSLSTIDEMRCEIKTVIKNICTLINEEKPVLNRKLAEEIESYIMKNYCKKFS